MNYLCHFQFTTSLPIQLSCRIMDCFLADGIEAIFRLALSLLLLGKNELLVQDMEGVIRVKMNVFLKTFTENWVGKQSFFVLILTTA